MKNYKRMISLNKASMVTGVNIVTMRKDIEKGRLDAIMMPSGERLRQLRRFLVANRML